MIGLTIVYSALIWVALIYYGVPYLLSTLSKWQEKTHKRLMEQREEALAQLERFNQLQAQRQQLQPSTDSWTALRDRRLS